MNMQTEILIYLFICHFLADFTHLQNNFMLDAKRFGKPIVPIFLHASVHSLLMTICLLLFGIEGLILVMACFIQLISHFAIDLWKGRMNVWIPTLQNPTNKWHWVVFGFDQLLHSFVIIFISNFVLLECFL